MDEDSVAGSVERAQGSAKQAAGNLFGDTKLQAEGAAERAAGTVREATGAARDAAREAETSPQAEVRHLREEVDEVAAETTADAAQVEGYARRAEAVVDRRTEAITEAILGPVLDHPLLAVGGAALLGYLLGRLTGGATYIYRR